MDVHFHYRPNTGYDFGGYIYGLQKLEKSYKYYFFLNCSVCGPFYPTYLGESFDWMQIFIEMLRGDVHLVGPTINVVPPNCIINRTSQAKPVVQSYMFVLTQEGLDFLRPTVFAQEYSSFVDVGLYQEVGMSSEILNHGWNINCLIPEYHDLDYRQVKKVFNPATIETCGDYAFHKAGKLFGRTPHPYEVIFIKYSYKYPMHLPVVKSLLSQSSVHPMQ